MSLVVITGSQAHNSPESLLPLYTEPAAAAAAVSGRYTRRAKYECEDNVRKQNSQTPAAYGGRSKRGLYHNPAVQPRPVKD